jgi:hypothetical protein
METVQNEGGHQTSREIEFYNLDAVILRASFPRFAVPWRPVLARRGSWAQGNKDARSMPHRQEENETHDKTNQITG